MTALIKCFFSGVVMYYIQGIVKIGGEDLICVVNMNTGSTEFFTYSRLVEFFRDKSVSNMRGVRKSGNELWLSFSEGNNRVSDFKFQRIVEALGSDSEIKVRKASDTLKTYLSAMSIGATIDVSFVVHWSVGHVPGRNLCYEKRHTCFVKIANDVLRYDGGFVCDYGLLADCLKSKCLTSIVVNDSTDQRIIIFDNVKTAKG